MLFYNVRPSKRDVLCVDDVQASLKPGKSSLRQSRKAFDHTGALDLGASWKALVTLARELCVMKFHYLLVTVLFILKPFWP